MFRRIVLSAVVPASLVFSVMAGTPAVRADQHNQDSQANQQQSDQPQDRATENQRGSNQQRDQEDQNNRETHYRGAEHAVLGVTLSEGDGHGVRIREVLPESPAQAAGLEQGDQIAKIDDQRVHNYRQVIDYLNRAKPEQTANITVSRDGQEKSFQVTLASRERVYGNENRHAQGRSNDRSSQFQSDRRNESRGQQNERGNNGRQDASYANRQQGGDGAHGQQAALGVDVQNDQNRLVVRDVWRNSTAERAGLRPGDQLEALDDQTINSRSDLQHELRDHQPGDRVNLTIRRNGRERTVAMNLTSRQEGGRSQNQQNEMQGEQNRDRFDNRQFASRGRTGYQRWSISHPHPALGVTLEESDDGYLTVARVMDDGPAEKAGLQRGDEILTIDDHPVDSVRDVMQQLSRKNPNDKVDVQIRRDGKKRDVDVTLGDSSEIFNDRRTAAREDRDDQQGNGQRNERGQNRDNDQDGNRDSQDRD
ncbi:MAG TPA: PDZ domain-containing protein [Pirellulales bacterium]|jgi:S1-C subfamily serine protease